jgi:septal ring factor EnvC (AmiA/AmiB activator)
MRIFLGLKPFLTPLIFIFFSIFTLYPAPLLPDQGRIEEKKAELESLKKKIGELQQSLADKQSELREQDANLKQVDLRINEINGNLRELEKRKMEVNRELSKLENRKSEITSKLEGEEEVLSQHLRSAYISGHEEYIKLLMNQQDPATISRMLVYYRYLTENRVATIRKINTLLEKLQLVEGDITTRSAELDSLISTQKERWLLLRQAYSEQAEALKSLRDEIASNEERIQRYRSDEQELVSLIDKLRVVIDELLDEEKTSTSFRQLKGRLKLPADARVAVRYGTRRDIGNLRWNGIILAGKLGSDVRAIYNGRVVYADWMRGFGLLLIIDHGDAYMSLYGQNESLLVEEGDWVEAGQQVATMGKSGGQSDPGLYFEIRYKGRPQNPLRWARR